MNVQTHLCTICMHRTVLILIEWFDISMYSEVAREYCKRTREVTTELLRGISKSWGLEECYVEKAMNFDTGFQLFAVNLYPPCPQPEQAIGIPAHTDHSLFTLLIENEIGGLQIQHNGEWFNVNPIPNSFLVNTGDHLEVECFCYYYNHVVFETKLILPVKGSFA